MPCRCLKAEAVYDCGADYSQGSTCASGLRTSGIIVSYTFLGRQMARPWHAAASGRDLESLGLPFNNYNNSKPAMH